MVSPPPHPSSTHSAAIQANEAIRRFVAGRSSWGPSELAELDRLRHAWRRALQGAATPG